MIHVTVARGRIRVRDNGPGIPPETVASILDFTTRTSSREAFVAPDRGRQGKVEIVNLGLEPWEGVAMGLEVEAVEGTERNRPVAPYVAEHDGGTWRSWLTVRGCDSWSDWLQSYRIELNAMPPADRIAWITRKIENYPPQKVIPPASHTLPELRDKAQAFVRSELTDELTRRAAIDERVAAAMGSIKWPWPKPETVTAEIEQGLEAAPHSQWSEPLHYFARRIASPIAKQALAGLDEDAER